MSESREQSPGDGYFNDLSQQLSGATHGSDERRGSQEETVNGQVPKPKRIACVLCRKRKLKCDGNKPSCGTCSRLQHDCSYDEVRRKSGPKRGYVKALEARLAQVETLLKTQDDLSTRKRGANGHAPTVQGNGMVPEFDTGRNGADLPPHAEQTATRLSDASQSQSQFEQTMLRSDAAAGAAGVGDANMNGDHTWEMIGLGLDEPLPSQDVVNELNQTYFEKIHPCIPMVHRPRYCAAMNLAPHMRPPVCLRYAMWCNAAAATDKYDRLQEHFYQRARKYVQQDEMKGHGESMITIAHCQTWILLATYEFKLMYFPRAWLSSGRASRLAQMMGMHRLDAVGLDVKQCLPPPKDWTEREERRRTFWMAFCVDRYSSIGTGWPMTIEERDIFSHLPGDDESYELSRPCQLISLAEALTPEGPPRLSAFGGVVLLACLFGRNLTHLHRPNPDDREVDLNGGFWKRHQSMDDILLNTALALPDPLRLPAGLNNPNVVFMNMNIHTSTICLHQAAIFKAEKNHMPSRISAESKIRCITAAAEIASIMRQISHLDLSAMNPFISFCLYVSARVFVQYLKSRPKDAQIVASLRFLLAAMHAMKRKNHLTESFLVQLDIDLEGAGLEDSDTLRSALQPKTPPVPNKTGGCSTAHLGLNEIPRYGDNGLGLYNNPNANANIAVSAPQQTSSFGYADMNELPNDNSMGFDLPTRDRTPGSNQGSGMHHSPPSFTQDMEITPGSNVGGENLSPNSQSQHNSSSHTSTTAYSPGNIQQQDQPPSNFTPLNNNIYAPGNNDFNTTFYPGLPAHHPQPDFSLPPNWEPGTGLTPGVSGFPEPMGMTDAEWHLLMENYAGWEGGGMAEGSRGIL